MDDILSQFRRIITKAVAYGSSHSGLKSGPELAVIFTNESSEYKEIIRFIERNNIKVKGEEYAGEFKTRIHNLQAKLETALAEKDSVPYATLHWRIANQRKEIIRLQKQVEEYAVRFHENLRRVLSTERALRAVTGYNTESVTMGLGVRWIYVLGKTLVHSIQVPLNASKNAGVWLKPGDKGFDNLLTEIKKQNPRIEVLTEDATRLPTFGDDAYKIADGRVRVMPWGIEWDIDTGTASISLEKQKDRVAKYIVEGIASAIRYMWKLERKNTGVGS